MHMPPVGLPILLFLACAAGLAVVLLVIPHITNPSRPGRVTRMPYESGMDPIHDTHRRFDVRFNMQAIAFLVFDVELLFLYPWAVASRPATVPASEVASLSPVSELIAGAGPVGINAAVELGWVSSRDMVFAGAMVFFVLLAVGFVYDWRKGVFRWQ
ncbi:MAG: NADH-quinone oxidoreductase subunit A [Planctomycetota bacterium]